jgi:hypothetical protein
MKTFIIFTRLISNKKLITTLFVTSITLSIPNLLYSQINLIYSIGGIGNFTNKATSITASTYSNPILLTGTKCFTVSNGLVKFMPVSNGQFFTSCEVNLDYIKLNISVYPNPATSYTKIKFLNQLQTDDKFRVQLYSSVGDYILGIDVSQKQLLSGYNLSLDNVSAGIYYIQISSNTVLQTVKILKK